MYSLRWTNNLCTVGWTCLHGSFTPDELDTMLKYCPSGSFTPTFSHERLAACGHSNTARVREVGIKESQGYYFNFPLTQAKPLFVWIAVTHPSMLPLKLENSRNLQEINQFLPGMATA